MIPGRLRVVLASMAAAVLGVAAWQVAFGGLAAHAATAATVFVSPSGDDVNSGTSAAQAVRTLGRAQQLVRGLNRNMTGDVRVQLAGGTYRMTAPLQLDAHDSGTGGFNVVWTAASGARPVLNGGVALSGPEPGGAGIPPTSVENAFELLDTAGEWYLDRPANTVYYIPRSGENLATATVTAPVLQQLVTGNGVQHVVFNGLQFSYATWLTPSSDTGFSEIQAGYTITGSNGFAVQGLCDFAPGGTCPYGAWTKEPANVSFTNARNVQFTNNGFVHLGAAGLDLGNGSQNDLVKGNVFTDISGNGIELGAVDKPLATGADKTTANTIADNYIFAAAVEYKGGVGILVGYAEKTLITHNQLDTLTYTAICIGWGGWPDKKGLPAQPNFSNHNVLSNNLIFNYMTLLNDGGGIYTQGRTGSSFATGEQITGNVLHDQKNKSGGHVVYTDNGAAFISIKGNAMYNSSVSSEGHDHKDTTSGTGNDPIDIEGNYWTKGRADSTANGVIIKNNHPITSPSQIPSSIVDNAGLESAFQSLLNWQPAS